MLNLNIVNFKNEIFESILQVLLLPEMHTSLCIHEDVPLLMDACDKSGNVETFHVVCKASSGDWIYEKLL